MRKFRNIALASVSLLSVATPAFAQSAEQDADAADERDSSEIVVTGTLIRGIAPGGSQSIDVDSAKIASVWAPNTSDLIASIPQTGNFLTYVGVRGSSNFSLAVNRPVLRYLGFTSSSTASTLLLLDGHRMPGMGILQTTADLDAIPSGAIERVEIVTDGGSSTYGSDAVGGVINFITRKNVEGVEAKGSFGFGDSYKQANAALTVGTTIDSISLYATYDFARHDPLFGADRGWSQSRDWINNLGSDVTCQPGNLTFGGTATVWALPGLTPGLGNRCDLTEFRTFYARETKHSALASVTVDDGGPVSFSVKGFYVHRVNTSESSGPFTANLGVPATSPFYIPVPGQTGTETFRVHFGDVTGYNVKQVSRLESYGITPSLKADMGGGWQLNAFANYGIGNAGFKGPLINAAILAGAAAAGTFNPGNLGAAGNAATITTARDWFQMGRAKNTLINGRAVVDGPLFQFPGGDVRAAAGIEYIYERYSGFTTRSATAATIAATPNTVVDRNVKSAFGEINLPIVGEENRGFHSLTITASGRYDEYSDFGSTFNPKIGVNIEPFDWLKLRANWGKAFQAPGLSDLAQPAAQISILSTAQTPFFDPATPRPAVGHNTFLAAVGGTIPGLKPQKAKTWSLGFDMKPPIVPGLVFGATYYNIDFRDIITIGPINLPTFYAIYADKAVLFTKGDPAMAAFFDQISVNATPAAKLAALAQLQNTFANVYSVLDGRTQNQARVETSGIDFYLRYNHETDFGDIYADIAGTYLLTLIASGTTGWANVNGVEPNNKFKVASTLGANIGNLRAQVTWAHTAGEDIAPTAQNLQQSRVKGMDVFNLFFQYRVPGESVMLKDLVFSLNVDNVFDVDPPLYRGGTNSLFGAANGFTLGRIIKFGVSKKF